MNTITNILNSLKTELKKQQMNMIEIMRFSLCMFKTRRLRASLTTLWTSVGIGTILFLVRLGYGLQNIITKVFNSLRAKLKKQQMSMVEIMRFSLRMFKTRRLRTSLTILGTSVGIGTILFLIGLGYGLQNIIITRITTSDALLSLDVTPPSSGIMELNDAHLTKIKAVSYVDEVSPVIALPSQITVEKFTGDAVLYGVKPSYFKLSGVASKAGDVLQDEKSTNIIISEPLLSLFGLGTAKEALGKKVLLDVFVPKIMEEGVEEVEIIKLKIPFTITGVVQEEILSYAFIDIIHLEQLKITTYAQAKVKVVASTFLQSVRAEIMTLGFTVSAISDTIEQANKIFRIVKIVLAIFGITALFISAIGMFNTMTIALLERTSEIGIMKALGISHKDIWKIFMSESVIMGFLGGIGGLVIGIATSQIFNFAINILARSFGGQSIDLFYYPLWFVLTITIFSAVLGICTGLYPARRASKLTPLEALRYK